MINLGHYDMILTHMDVFADPNSTGGSFDLHKFRMTIGTNYSTWAEVLNVAIHELIEVQLVILNCRLSPSPDYARASDGYSFYMSHCQYSEALARAAVPLALLIPKLQKIWKDKHNGKARNV